MQSPCTCQYRLYQHNNSIACHQYVRRTRGKRPGRKRRRQRPLDGATDPPTKTQPEYGITGRRIAASLTTACEEVEEESGDSSSVPDGGDDDSDDDGDEEVPDGGGSMDTGDEGALQEEPQGMNIYVLGDVAAVDQVHIIATLVAAVSVPYLTRCVRSLDDANHDSDDLCDSELNLNSRCPLLICVIE